MIQGNCQICSVKLKTKKKKHHKKIESTCKIIDSKRVFWSFGQCSMVHNIIFFNKIEQRTDREMSKLHEISIFCSII